MINKSLGFAIVCLLLVAASFSPAAAQTNSDKAAARIAKIKAKIIKLESKNSPSASIELKSGKLLRGSVSQAGADSFTFTDAKTRQTSTIFYADVEKASGGFPKSATIAILAGFAAAGTILAVIVYGQYHH